jgi:HEAT repeat protein
MTVSQAFEEADRFSLQILFIATTGDPRGLPILRKALSSSNNIIQGFAAKGLAVLQDKESIPRIIDAAHRAPLGAQSLIAEPLVAFNDRQAQAAADELVTDKNLLEDLRERIKEKGPRAVW